MSYRLLDQNPVYLDNAGQPLSGGFLAFYDTGTTTPKNTWSDKGLTVLNANPVQLDSAGRANTEIWGSGSYRVRLYDADMNQVYQRDNVDELLTGSGLPDPTGSAGLFVYSPDGVVYALVEIREVPDPTGSSGKYLYTADGVNLSWRNKNLAPSVTTITSSASVAPIATSEATEITAQSGPLAMANPTGSWSRLQPHVVAIKDNGTARAITWDTKYRAASTTLPTTTVISKTLYVAFLYNATDDKFDVTGVSQVT